MRADVIRGSAVCITECEDGSVLVEVIHPNNLFRFGVSFEPDEKDSHWYFVSKPECEMGELMIGEALLPEVRSSHEQ